MVSEYHPFIIHFHSKLYSFNISFVSTNTVYLDDIRLDRIDNKAVQIVSLKDYYPFGAVMKGRSYTASSGKYRYGFNGKEYDEESEYSDFGARLYDAGIGRWNSMDAHATFYPAVSPYAFCFNSPLLFTDDDGNDGKITVIPDPSGSGGKIIISTIVYITGYRMSTEFATKLTKAASDYLEGGEYTDKRLGTWEVTFDIKYKYIEKKPKFREGSDNHALDVEEGNNVMIYSKYEKQYDAYGKEIKQVRSNVGSQTKKVNGCNQSFIDNYGAVKISDEESSDENIQCTTIHETLHMLGLYDRYYDRIVGSQSVSTPFDPSWSGDVMSTGEKDLSKRTFSNVHIQHYVEQFARKKAYKTFVRSFVDIAHYYKDIADNWRLIFKTFKNTNKGYRMGTRKVERAPGLGGSNKLQKATKK